jgi:hypothetical protein
VEKTPETINRTADATTGQARRTAGAVDQANQRLEHTVDVIDGGPSRPRNVNHAPQHTSAR